MFSTLDDREIDGLLSGQPTANAELASLVEVVATLRRSVGDIVPAMSASLRAQLRATPVVPITARQASRSALYKAGAVAAAALAVVGLGVGASQNRLPGELQDVLSSTADIIGIHIPATSERDHGGSDADGAGKRGSSNGNDDGVPGGGNDNTNGGGATPADPGTPGDQAPATPATPPEQSNGTPGGNGAGNPNENSDRGNDSIGDTAPPPVVTAPAPPSTVPSPPTTEATPAVEPEEEAAELGNGNASANGDEHGIGATGAQGNGPGGENGNGASGGNGGGPPDTTFKSAGNGPPAGVLAG